MLIGGRRHARRDRLAPIQEAVVSRHLAKGWPILMLSGCGWSCSGGGQRPVALARAWARTGYPVIYHSIIDGPLREVDGVLVTGSPDLEAIVPLLAATAGTVIATLPSYMRTVRRLPGWRFVYDLLDDWDAFVAAKDLSPASIAEEPEMLARAEAVTCSAPALVERAQRLGAANVQLVLNGGPEEMLPRPAELPDRMLAGPVRAVYSGYLFGSWLDWRIFERMNDHGRLATTVIGKYISVPAWGRVRFIGEKPYPDAMRYVAAAQVGVVPFKGELCRAVDAIKAYDYAAAGNWTVVTPDLEAHRGRPFTLVAGPDEFPDACAEAARKRKRPGPDYVRANAWSARAAQFAAWIGGGERRPESRERTAKRLPARAVTQAECRLRATWQAPACCNMQPECPYCSNAWERRTKPALPPAFDALVDGLEALAERHGPLYLSVCYGEPTSSRDVIAAIGRLGRRHKVDVSTNLLFPLRAIRDWPRNGNIRLATSFHPHRWLDLAAFIAKRREIEASGIECGIAEIVAYPPYLLLLPGWCEELRAAGIEPHVGPFHGGFEGRAYPDSYTPEEREWVWGQVEACYGECRTGEDTSELLCRTGAEYVYIEWSGVVRRCYMPRAQVLGNLADGDVALLPGPTPCAEQQCPCPDMWRYLVPRSGRCT